MNLLMMAPLLDAKGKLRYYIGAQVDVSELVKDCTDLEAFRHMLDKEEGRDTTEDAKDEFQELCEMFNVAELDTVRKHGGGMHREHLEGANGDTQHHKPRLLLKDPSKKELDAEPIRFSRNPETKLSGVYKHVSLVPHIITRFILTWPIVPSCPPSPLSPHPLHFPFPSRTRHSSIPVSRPRRWFHPRPGLSRGSPCGWHPGRHC